MRHRRHRWIAALLAFVLAFAQVVVAAHGCPIADTTATPPGSDASTMAAMPDCDAMPAPHAPAANACEAHCLVGQVQGDGNAYAPVAVLPALVVRMLPAWLDDRSAVVDAEAPLPTPPPLLRFTRLLI